jgi:hypothetical protein
MVVMIRSGGARDRDGVESERLESTGKSSFGGAAQTKHGLRQALWFFLEAHFIQIYGCANRWVEKWACCQY